MLGEEETNWGLLMLTLAVKSRESVVDAEVAWEVALTARVGFQGQRLTRRGDGLGPDLSHLGRGTTKGQLKLLDGKKAWASLLLETMAGATITEGSIIRIRIRIKAVAVPTIARVRDRIATCEVASSSLL